MSKHHEFLDLGCIALYEQPEFEDQFGEDTADDLVARERTVTLVIGNPYDAAGVITGRDKAAIAAELRRIADWVAGPVITEPEKVAAIFKQHQENEAAAALLNPDHPDFDHEAAGDAGNYDYHDYDEARDDNGELAREALSELITLVHVA